MSDIIIFGKDCALYIGAAGSEAGTLVGNVRDLTLRKSRNEVEAGARDSGSVEEFVTSLKSYEISFTLRVRLDDPNYETLDDAYDSGDPIAALCLTAPKTVANAKGIDGDFVVTSFVESQPLNGIVTVDVSLKPTPSTRVVSRWTYTPPP